MATRVEVGNGKYCYTGPTCNLHSKHWAEDAQKRVKEAKSKLGEAETFEEFTSLKNKINEAEAQYDKTTQGWTEIMSAAMKEDASDRVKERYAAASITRHNEQEAAISEFLSSQTVEERAAEVYETKDPEKIELYLNDDNPKVRANAALNKSLSSAQLHELAQEDNSTIQTNVILNKKTNLNDLKRLSTTSRHPGVKVLAKRELERRAAAKKRAETQRREREERLAEARANASRYSSYSYGGKGGGKR